MKKIIYADNAATTKLDSDAFEAMKPYLLNEYGNASSLYSLAREPKKALKDARAAVADCIGAQPEEIFFTSGGTESDNWALKGCAMLGSVKRPLITSVIEHHAILRSCEFLEYKGYPVAYLPVDAKGTVLPKTLQQIITPNTALVSIMLANNEIGTIQRINELSNIAHTAGAVFHTDAVQAVGHISVNVDALGVDMLSASAHKFNGPKGTGFLYVRNGTQVLPYANGGAQERHLRAGTENTAGIVGMAIALKKAVLAITEETKRLSALEHVFYDTLNSASIDYRVNGATEERLPGNINISLCGQSGEAILHRLDLKGIYISTGSACNSEETELSHVLQAIAVPERYAMGTIRISLGKYNTAEDAVTIAKTLIEICQGQP